MPTHDEKLERIKKDSELAEANSRLENAKAKIRVSQNKGKPILSSRKQGERSTDLLGIGRPPSGNKVSVDNDPLGLNAMFTKPKRKRKK